MGVKLLLEKAHVEGIRTYDVYRREGGYRSVEKAIKIGPEAIVEEVKRSGLRGRGGAGMVISFSCLVAMPMGRSSGMPAHARSVVRRSP